jgi:acid phosphatase
MSLAALQQFHRSVRSLVPVIALLALAGVTVIATPYAESAATAATPSSTLTASADSFVESQRPAQNFGTHNNLHADASPVRRSYVKFQSSLPSAPLSATLYLTARSTQDTGFVVRTSSSSWSESSIDYDNAPEPSANVCGRSGPLSSGERVSVDIDTALCPITAVGDTTFVLETTSSTDMRLASRETSNAPTLQIPSSDTSTDPWPSGTVTKLLVFVEENHSLSQMQTGMPYTFGLAEQYGYATNYTAITHPSLPNYIAIASGQTYGITDDDGPEAHPLNGSSVFGQAVSAGKTAKVYADGMTSNCMKSNTGRYVVKHNPWPYFTPLTETIPCASLDVPETELADDVAAGTLPNVGMVIPDLCNDAHSCSLSVADSWFETRMESIFAGPDWNSGHLAVVLTADEDDGSQGNRVLTVVIHPSQHQNVVSTALTHYSLTRLYEDVAQTSYLNNAATAPSMSSAFGLPMP